MAVCVRSKNLLITYPHCDLTNEDIRERLMNNPWLAQYCIKYMVVSKEFHQDGEEHHHVFINLQQTARIGRRDMKKFDLLIDNRGNMDMDNPEYYHPNIEACRSPKDAIKYVKKQGAFITYGTNPYLDTLSQKEKNELLLKKDLKELVENGEISIYKLPALQKAKLLYKNELLQGRFEKKQVYWYYGETGTGKTRHCWEKAKEIAEDLGLGDKLDEAVWVSNGTGQWFDGYQGQPIVIIDDLRANTWEFSWLLRLTDCYPMRVPIKGGFVRWVPNTIFITAPDEPRIIYSNHETSEPYDGIEQLERRITETKLFEKSD